jgi:ribosomal protein uS3
VRTEIIIRATDTQAVLGTKYKRIQELTSIVQKRFNFDKDQLTLFAEAVDKRGLCADAQAENLKHKLLENVAVRRGAYSVVRFIMEAGAKGCEVIVSGKLRAQRAKGMKFKEGYMIKTGEVSNLYVTKAVRHVMMRQGVLGIKVMIMLPHDPTGKNGPKQQHNHHFDTQNTLSHHYMTYCFGDIKIGHLTSFDHITFLELHTFSTLCSELS